MLIISNDSYFICGLKHISHKFIPSIEEHIIFDAGSGVVYVMSPSDRTELNNHDALSAFLANRYTTLPKNAPMNDYIDIINKEGRRKVAIPKPKKLTAVEIEVLEVIAYRFLEIPTPDIPQRKPKSLSVHKRNGLEKLGLKNDNTFCSLVASWHKNYSKLAANNFNSA